MLLHKIENSQVIFSKPRCLSPSENDQANKLCEEMLKDNVIRPSSSPYNSPIVMVQKKDGSTRFCIDYRKLKKDTKVSDFLFSPDKNEQIENVDPFMLKTYDISSSKKKDASLVDLESSNYSRFTNDYTVREVIKLTILWL